MKKKAIDLFPESFLKAYKKTMVHEGGYANIPEDKGGETYMGIARNSHPDWEGWHFIDEQKALHGSIPHNRKYSELELPVRSFYHTVFWSKWHTVIANQSQIIAEYLFDEGVNCGKIIAGRHLQRALNILNNNGALWSEITVDGFIGSNTYKAFDSCIARKRDRVLLNALIVLRGYYYIRIMEKRPTQEVFAYNWLTRLVADVVPK